MNQTRKKFLATKKTFFDTKVLKLLVCWLCWMVSSKSNFKSFKVILFLIFLHPLPLPKWKVIIVIRKSVIVDPLPLQPEWRHYELVPYLKKNLWISYFISEKFSSFIFLSQHQVEDLSFSLVLKVFLSFFCLYLFRNVFCFGKEIISYVGDSFEHMKLFAFFSLLFLLKYRTKPFHLYFVSNLNLFFLYSCS